MGQAPKEMERTVARGFGTAESWVELGGKRVMEAAEDYLENERLMEPEDEEVS